MPLFAIAGAALAAIVLAGTSAKKKAASSPRKKASSPKKKDLTSVVISSSKKMSKQPYLVIGWALKASGWEVFSVVKSREQTNDAYSRNFQLAVTDTLEFRPHGFIAVVLRRLAHDQNQAALNSQDGYPRKLFIRVIDDESTHESRMEAMNVIKEYMERPEHNRFGYTYLVNEESDLTPPQDQLEPMDAYLVDHQIVSLLQSVLEGADNTFYENNQDIADDFFSGPIYSQSAVDALGYPCGATIDEGGNGAIHANYNPPDAEDTTTM